MRKIADIVEEMGQTVTSGYKKIESGAVTGFEKVTNKCIEVLFTKDSESVEAAKARLAAMKDSKN